MGQCRRRLCRRWGGRKNAEKDDAERPEIQGCRYHLKQGVRSITGGRSIPSLSSSGNRSANPPLAGGLSMFIRATLGVWSTRRSGKSCETGRPTACETPLVMVCSLGKRVAILAIPWVCRTQKSNVDVASPRMYPSPFPSRRYIWHGKRRPGSTTSVKSEHFGGMCRKHFDVFLFI